MSILDHVTVVVSDLERSRTFYAAALAPLGIGPLMDFPGTCGFGRGAAPQLWLSVGPTSYQQPADVARITPVHLALAARSRAEVDAFHRAALAAGGRDFGAPGLRPEYHPTYYGAFVLDPDGHDLEAVFHGA